jgi:hypothetical protein
MSDCDHVWMNFAGSWDPPRFICMFCREPKDEQ